MDCKECCDFLQEVTILSAPVYVLIKMVYLFFQAEKDNKANWSEQINR